MKKKGNPQLVDGYTPIANELLESILLLNLGRSELKIILAIMRLTYGWSRKEAEISVSVFQKLTGLDRRNAVRAIKNLLDGGLISRSEGNKMKYGQPVYKYVINKKGYCQYDNRTIVNMTTEPIVNMTTNKTKKAIIKTRRAQLVEKLTAPKLSLILLGDINK